MRDPGSVRASDADREAVVQALRQHATAGRLDADELDARLESALAAHTHGELAALVDDLPGVSVPRPERPPDRRVERLWVAHRAGLATLFFVVCVVVWLLSGADGHFWPAWVILASFMALAPKAWRVFGPQSRLSNDDGESRH
jgi:hypothetical protein